MPIESVNKHSNYLPNQTLSFGQRKVPRFLYHITNADTWEKINNTGHLIQSKEDYMGKGIFMVDLGNLFKCWTKCYRESAKQNLADRLLEYINLRDGSKNLIIVKIQSDKLKRGKLLIRSQEILFKEVGSRGFSKRWAMWDATKTYTDKRFAHIITGDEATNARKYSRRHAIEYVYQEDIPVKDIEKIGEIDSTTVYKTPFIDIFKQLLKGTPEARAVLRLEPQRAIMA